MNIRYRVELSEAERAQLAAMLSGGKHAVRKLKRAQILLAADAGIKVKIIMSPADSYWNVVWLKRPFLTSTWGGRPTAEALPPSTPPIRASRCKRPRRQPRA